jgi:hypothetical protein
MAIHKVDLPLSGERSLAEGYFTISRCRRCGIVVGYGDHCDHCLHRPTEHRDEPGEYIGRHHTEWTSTVDELVTQGDDDEAELILWRLVDASERESAVTGVPPFERHYTRLAQLARRRKDSALAKRVKQRYEDRCAVAAAKARGRAS